MADLLRKLNKVLLLEVAEEFDTNLSPKSTIKDIRNAILGAPDFEVELLKILIERIMSEAEEKKNCGIGKISASTFRKISRTGAIRKISRAEVFRKLSRAGVFRKISRT